MLLPVNIPAAASNLCVFISRLSEIPHDRLKQVPRTAVKAESRPRLHFPAGIHKILEEDSVSIMNDQPSYPRIIPHKSAGHMAAV